MRLSAIGSAIAAASFSAKVKTAILTTGTKSMDSSMIIEVKPAAFLIRVRLPKTKSKPSERYPPRIGT